MSKERITIDYISGGQPRPYADSMYRTQVLFEHEVLMGPKAGELEPWDIDEKYIRERLLRLKCGFTEFRYPQDCKDPKEPTASEYFTPRLTSFKKISPGLWEFTTLSAYTD